jgi:glycosyltransferase involved in cell wall biosynthesis
VFLVCEAIAWGMEHVPFNAAFLRTIRLAYPDDTICFYAEESHSEHVLEQIGEEFAASIIWKKLILPPRHSSFYARLFKDFSNVKFLLNQLNENPQNHVLVITGNPSLLWAIKFTLHRDKRIQIIIHGDLEPLGSRRSLRLLIAPFYRISSIRTALKMFGSRHIQLIVLEEAIRDAVIKEIPLLKNSISVLEHPIPLDEYTGEAKSLSIPIHFGFLGLTTEHKGFLVYLNVAAAISKRFPERAKFHVVGRISDRYKHANLPEMAFLSEMPGTGRMSRSEYVRCVNNLHFVCMFFDWAYEFVASGVLLDSIAFGKPVIATQLTTFKNLAKRYGDIGYLCSPDEIIETVSSIIQQNDPDRYKRQALNISQARISRSPETLAIKYIELIEQL